MSEKVRMNITVDESVKRQLDARDDINASGAANQFFKRLLSGENHEKAAKRSEMERLLEKAEEKESKAENYRQQAKVIRAELQEEKQEREEKMERALEALYNPEPELKSVSSNGPRPPDPTSPATKRWAKELNMSPHELSDQYLELWEKYKGDTTKEMDRTYQ